MVSEKTVERFSFYRRLLGNLAEGGTRYIHSHHLAALAGSTAVQVRRDLMALGSSGSPYRGYGVADLIAAIERFLDTALDQKVVLVGVGNLGRAILAYYTNRRPRLRIVAAFDVDPQKTGRVIQGCRCLPLEDLESVVGAEEVRVGIVTVPAASAQEAADRLIRAGVRGLLNFAPLRLRVANEVFVENMDMTMALEKVAFFSRPRGGRKDIAG